MHRHLWGLLALLFAACKGPEYAQPLREPCDASIRARAQGIYDGSPAGSPKLVDADERFSGSCERLCKEHYDLGGPACAEIAMLEAGSDRFASHVSVETSCEFHAQIACDWLRAHRSDNHSNRIAEAQADAVRNRRQVSTDDNSRGVTPDDPDRGAIAILDAANTTLAGEGFHVIAQHRFGMNGQTERYDWPVVGGTRYAIVCATVAKAYLQVELRTDDANPTTPVLNDTVHGGFESRAAKFQRDTATTIQVTVSAQWLQPIVTVRCREYSE